MAHPSIKISLRWRNKVPHLGSSQYIADIAGFKVYICILNPVRLSWLLFLASFFFADEYFFLYLHSLNYKHIQFGFGNRADKQVIKHIFTGTSQLRVRRPKATRGGAICRPANAFTVTMRIFSRVSASSTLKQPVWQLMSRCSMVILASLPTGSPQYVQRDDSGPLEMHSQDD